MRELTKDARQINKALDTLQPRELKRAAAKKEIEAAGFVLDGESKLLHRDNDTHTLPSGSDTQKDKADEFMLRFKRPA